MNTPSPYEQLPESFARYIDQVCDQFESELQHGRQPDPAAYLATCPEAARAILHAELRQLLEHYRFQHDATATIAWTTDIPTDSTAPVAEGDPRYVWLREIGIGGMGRVSLCIDQQMGRPVAVKELRPELLGNIEATARFRQEARITGRLSHPSIVPVYELVNPAPVTVTYSLCWVRTSPNLTIGHPFMASHLSSSWVRAASEAISPKAIR